VHLQRGGGTRGLPLAHVVASGAPETASCGVLRPGGCITRASRKTLRASGRQMRATHPLALLATATAAVHHPGITGTSFGGSRRNRGPPRTAMVEPNLAIRRALGRRIRLTGLLRKSPAFAGFFSWPDGHSSRLHHDIEDRALQSAGTEGRPRGKSAWLSEIPAASVLVFAGAERRLLTEDRDP
jgi:hypothetical protein